MSLKHSLKVVDLVPGNNASCIQWREVVNNQTFEKIAEDKLLEVRFFCLNFAFNTCEVLFGCNLSILD